MKSLIEKIKRPRGKQDSTDADGNVRSSSKNNNEVSVSASNNASVAAAAAEFQRKKKERQQQQQEQQRLFRKKSVYSIETKDLEEESPEMDLVKALENNKLDKFKKLWRWDEKGDAVKVEKDYEDWFVDDPNFIITTTRKKDGEGEPQVIQMNILNIATIYGKLSFLRCILHHPELDFNMRDSKGVNAIWYAAKTQNYDAMELLMKFRQKGKEHAQGCLLDPTYHHIDHGMNPLHMVVTFENYKLAELMLKQAKDNYLFKWNDKYGTYDDLKSREYLNSAKRNGVTTLQIGIIKKNTKLVKLMIDYGADVNLQDKISTACPLYLAIKLKTPVELVDQLLYGSYPQVPIVNHKERKEIEMSPLFLAIFNRDMPLLKKLVELGREKKQIDFMVLATCNNVPPLFYVLKRQEKVLFQAHAINKGQPIFVNGKEKKMSLSDITGQLTVLQKMSEYLIQFDVDETEQRKEKGIKVDQDFLRSHYNREHEPEVTILWKTMQLANYPVASLLLDYGLGTVDYQMKESGETCLLKALKDDIISDASVCINNEVDREEIIRFLLDDGDDWWSDPKMVDSVDGYQHSAELAMRKHLKDYMQSFQNIYLYNLDKQHELQDEAKIKAAEVRKKALDAYKSKTKPKIQEKVQKQIKDKIEAEKKIIEQKRKEKEDKKLSKLNQPIKKVQPSETVKYRNTEIDKLKSPYDFNKLRMYESDDIIIDHANHGAPSNDIIAANDPLKAVTFMHRQDIKVVPLVQVDDFTGQLQNLNQFHQQKQQQPNQENGQQDQTNNQEQSMNQKNDEVNLLTPSNLQKNAGIVQTPHNPQGLQLSQFANYLNMSQETNTTDQAPFKYENGKYSINFDFQNYKPILNNTTLNSLVEFTDQSLPPDEQMKLKYQQSNFMQRKQSQSKSESNFIDQKAAASQQAIDQDQDLEKKNQTEIDEQTQSTKYEVTHQINSKNIVREPSADFMTQPTDNYQMLGSIKNAPGLKKNGVQHSSISNLVFTKKNTIENTVFPHPTIIVKDNENSGIATPTSGAIDLSKGGATPHNPRANYPQKVDLSQQPGLMNIKLPEGSKKVMNKYDLQVLMMDVQQLELFKEQASGLKQSVRKPPNFELLDKQINRPIPNLYENNEPVLPKIFNAQRNEKIPEDVKENHEKDRTYMKQILEKMKNGREFVMKQQFNKDYQIKDNLNQEKFTKAYNSISDDQFNKQRLEESYKISLIKNLPIAVQQQVKYMGPEELDTVYKLNRRKYLDFKAHESIVIPAIQSTTNQKIASEIKMNIDADHYIGAGVIQKGTRMGDVELDMNGRSLEQKIKEEFDNLPHRKEQWQIHLKELSAAEQEEIRKRQKELDDKMQAQIDDGKVKLLQKDIDKANKFIKDTHQIQYASISGKPQRSASSKIFRPFQVKGFSKFETEVIQLEPEPIKHEPIIVPVEEKQTEMVTRARDYSQMMTKFQNPRTNIRMTQSALKAMEYNTHRYGLHQGIKMLNDNTDKSVMIYDTTDQLNNKSQSAINLNSRFSTPVIDKKKQFHSHQQSISQTRPMLPAQINQQSVNRNQGSVKHEKGFRAGNIQNFDILNKKSSLQNLGNDSVKNMFSAAEYHANSYDNIHNAQSNGGDGYQSQKMGESNNYRMLNSRSTNPYDEFERSIPQGQSGSNLNQTPMLRGAGNDNYNQVVQGAVNRRLPQNQIQVKRNNANQLPEGSKPGALGGTTPSDPTTAQSVEPWEESFILPKIVKVQNSPLLDQQNKGKAKVLTQSPSRTKPKTLQTKKVYLV